MRRARHNNACAYTPETMSEVARPKRKASASLRARTSRGNTAPSSAHYVGYVQDDETPEMIMKKFEEMERIRQQARAGAENGDEAKETTASAEEGDEEGLDEEQLKELFRNTSTFTVKEAMFETSELFGTIGDLDEAMYFSDDDGEMQDEFWEALTGRKRKGKKSRGGPRIPRAPKAPREPKAAASHMITAYNSDQGLFLRKKKFIDPAEPYIIKVPPHPIPVSWGRVIEPLCQNLSAWPNLKLRRIASTGKRTLRA